MKTRIALLVILAGLVPASLAFAAHGAKLAASHNWAGYVAQGAGYSAVSGAWVVPEVAASPAESASAEWVGIGGMQGKDLIQAGTRARTENGAVSYEAWYELYPAPAVPVALAVHAGDTMRASLSQDSAGTWTITLADVTTGASFTTTQHYASSGTSAEWIVEAPGTAGGALLALDHFSPIAFASAGATKGGIAESPAALKAAGLSLVDASSTVLATPSQLTSRSSGFTVVRQ